jgi:hypothetical protein
MACVFRELGTLLSQTVEARRKVSFRRLCISLLLPPFAAHSHHATFVASQRFTLFPAYFHQKDERPLHGKFQRKFSVPPPPVIIINLAPFAAYSSPPPPRCKYDDAVSEQTRTVGSTSCTGWDHYCATIAVGNKIIFR